MKAIRRISLPKIRQQADTSDEPGEASLSPLGLWDRSQSDWTFGAGQTFLDRADSDRRRFRISKGIDPWTKGRIKLQPDTTKKRISANTNVRSLVVGTYLYTADGNDLVHTQSLSGVPTFTDAVIQAGEGAQTVQSITTDGFRVYAALGSNGIHRTDRGAVVSSHYSDLQAQLVGYVKGRLMAAKDNVIYNVIASGAAPAALLTHPNTDFDWTGFASGPGHIYASGFSGGKSEVYKTAIKADGTALDAPTQAIEDYPDGEIIRSLYSYLGLVFIGTDKGVRMAKADDSGNLTVGALIPHGSAVRAFEGQDRFIWAGLTNYDGTSTGLLRMDPLHLTEGIAPAYATDLMATAQGDVLSAFTFGDKRGFTVSGSGLWYQDTALVPSGEIRPGIISYGTSRDKVWKFLDLTFPLFPAGSTITLQLDVDGTLSTSGQFTLTESRLTYDPQSKVGSGAEPIITLGRATDTTQGPELSQWTTRANPIGRTGERFDIPVQLYETVVTRGGMEVSLDPEEEYSALRTFEREGLPITVQIGTLSFEAFVGELSWADLSFTADGFSLQGTAVISVRRFD